MRPVRLTTVLLALLAVGAAAVIARALVRSPRPESTIPPPPAAVEHPLPPGVNADFSPAGAEEARAALARAFGPVLEPSGPPAVGDFNGDGAPDLAVPVRAVPDRLPEINRPLANWTIQDGAPPAPLPSPHPHLRAEVEAGEPLLAIVHGYGAHGWRDPAARQAYLVKNGKGAAVARLRSDFPDLDAPQGQRSGHVLAAAGTAVAGVVYWTGAAYAWRAEPAGAAARTYPR